VSEALSDRAGLFRLVSWVVLLLSALFLLTSGGTYPGIASVEGHILGQVIGYVVLGSWLVVSLFRPEWRPTTPLVLPVLVATVAYALSAVFSQRQRLSFEPTIAGIGWALGFLFLTCVLARPWFRARVGVLLTAFVAVVAIGYLVQVAIEWINWWQLIGRFALPPLRPSFAALFLGSPNLIATALILAAPLVVALWWSRPRGRWLAWGLAIASALAAFVSGSRGAYLGVAAGTVAAVMLLALRGGGRRSTVGSLVDRFRARPVLLVPVVVVLGLGAVFAPAVLNRFAQGGADLRFDLWRSAATIFAEHPILGGGPGSWVQLKVAANPAGVPNLILPHAHDMYVQAAAEVGIVGLLALAWLGIAVVRRLWAGWRSTGGSISLEAGAVIVSLTAFAGQSIVDNLSNLPFVILLVVILVAWVDGRLSERVAGASQRSLARGRTSVLASPIPTLAALIALVVLVPSLIRVDGAALTAQRGDAYALHGQWRQALEQYNAARDQDAAFTLYALQQASALARLNDPEAARDVLEEAVAEDPVSMNVIGLAALEQQLGDTEAARTHLLQAAASGIGEPAVALNAGLVAERLGDLDVALDQFANAIAWDPALASSDLWTSPPRKLDFATILAAARGRTGPLDAALIRAYAGDAIGAREELERQPTNSSRDLYVAIVIGLAGDAATAFASFDRTLQANPSDWLTAAYAARLARRLQADDEAADYSMWAIAVQGDSAPGVIQEASVVPASTDDASASVPLNYPWSMYLRPISPYTFMPQLTLIGLK